MRPIYQRSALGAPADNGPAPASAPRVLIETALQEGLVVTYWFDPAPCPKVHSVTIRFYGTRVGVVGKPAPRDRFVRDETAEGVLADGGPVSVTARIKGINLGEWMVTSEMRPVAHERDPRRQPRALPTPQPLYLAAWSWLKMGAVQGARKRQ